MLEKQWSSTAHASKTLDTDPVLQAGSNKNKSEHCRTSEMDACVGKHLEFYHSKLEA